MYASRKTGFVCFINISDAILKSVLIERKLNVNIMIFGYAATTVTIWDCYHKFSSVFVLEVRAHVVPR